MSDTISFYPVDNGDTIMFKIGAIRALVDIHYRQSADKDKVHFDVQKQISKDCPQNALDYFILTHPHDDHVRGFDSIFHCGTPERCPSTLLMVKEIICTSYSANLKNYTDVAKPLINEIKRRKKLSKKEQQQDGNRLTIVEEGDTIYLGDMVGKVLSPSLTELENAENNPESDGHLINNTALSVMWTYSKKHNILLGSDTEHDVWNRLGKKYSSQELTWQLCEAGHHCSRSVYSYKNEDGEYVEDKDAIDALSHIDGDGFVVASSKVIKNNEDNPPSWEARKQWINFLKAQDSGKPETRFVCTADSKDDKGELVPLIFNLDKKLGVGRSFQVSSKKHVTVGAGTAAGYAKPVSYGA